MKKGVTYKLQYNDFIPQAILDYHTLGILNSYEIEKFLEDFFIDCEFLGYKRVLVVTGKGAVVRPLVTKLLKASGKVETFSISNYFNGQDGAFQIVLK